MNKIQTFQEFLTTQSVQVPVFTFVLNLLLAALLGYILSLVYVRYGKALSNRRGFAANFILMAMTTMLIISIVKSSLALSLGLVGALSIVRFRAAIKEPEELAYLFPTISIGLGLGADQTVITIVAFLIIIGIIWFKNRSEGKEKHDKELVVLKVGDVPINVPRLKDIIKSIAQKTLLILTTDLANTIRKEINYGY